MTALQRKAVYKLQQEVNKLDSTKRELDKALDNKAQYTNYLQAYKK
jgi:hypothetical protein